MAEQFNHRVGLNYLMNAVLPADRAPVFSQHLLLAMAMRWHSYAVRRACFLKRRSLSLRIRAISDLANYRIQLKTHRFILAFNIY